MKDKTRDVCLTYDEMREICCALDMRGDYFDEQNTEKSNKRAVKLYALSERLRDIRRIMMEENEGM